MVEFLLVLFPLIVFVGGIVQLGIGIANWHDMNRIANEGARFAATGAWPDCPAAETSCTGNPVCRPVNPALLFRRSLENYLRCEATDAGLPASAVASVRICRPAATAITGDPIRVEIDSDIDFLSLDDLGANKIGWKGIDLHAEATMRLERSATKFPVVAC